jgi:hypothetical protein
VAPGSQGRPCGCLWAPAITAMAARSWQGGRWLWHWWRVPWLNGFSMSFFPENMGDVL